MLTNLRIHVVPVGFQFKRVTEPLINMRADKVFFIRVKQGDDAQPFYDKIIEELESNYNSIEKEDVFLDIWDLYSCIVKFKEIITKEISEGNTVYFNVSTGSKITAMAGLLTCMAWGGVPYYAKVAYSDTQLTTVDPSEYVEEPQILPVYEMKLPKKEMLIILSYLDRNGRRARKTKLIDMLEKEGMIVPRDEKVKEFTTAAKHSQLRAIIDPMEKEWGFVRIESRGRRSDVIITEKGVTALKMFSSK